MTKQSWHGTCNRPQGDAFPQRCKGHAQLACSQGLRKATPLHDAAHAWWRSR